MQIQRNCLSVLNSFYPYIRTVLFDNHDLTSKWNLPNIIVVSTVRFPHFPVSEPSANPYGTPFFKPMIEYIESRFQSTFYGYCNGDLLFHSDLIPALHSLASRIQSGALKNRVFFVGRRINYDHQNIVPIPAGIDAQDTFITKYAEQGYLFQTDAQDYFFFTKNAIPWRFIVDVVVGRPGYDNYLVDFVYHRSREIDLIDTTNSSRIRGAI